MKRLYFFLILLLPIHVFGQQVDLVTPLQNSLMETSGLMFLNGRLITHNDSGGETALYEIDSVSGGISRTVIINNASNYDWEDVCHDETYIYIADFGNNNGNRTNLRIYRVLISDYFNTPNDTISADTIQFEYADQTDFTATSFATNFDAEAIISWNDSLYIFTKNWGDFKTNVYALSKQPGNYSIPRIDSINTEGMVTGATFNPSFNSIVLSGYAFNDPFVTEISGFTNSHFSSANVVRYSIQLTPGYSYQLEGIAPINDSEYYISTEDSFSGASGFFHLDLDPSNQVPNIPITALSIYPVPTSDYLNVSCPQGTQIELYSITGTLLISTLDHKIDVTEYNSGSYLILLKDDSGQMIVRKKIVIE